MRRWWCFFTMPSVGMSAPAIILSSVDFPAPFGPTNATRLYHNFKIEINFKPQTERAWCQ